MGALQLHKDKILAIANPDELLHYVQTLTTRLNLPQMMEQAYKGLESYSKH
eukprot:m.174150 g.174150  ORF g.174150 m.174150 type:complete len:51 (-) comp25267_c0_seq8:110-262(-)